MGVFIRAEFDPDQDPEVVASHMRAYEKKQRRREARALEKVRFPVYVVPGLDAALGGWGSAAKRTTGVDVMHGKPEDGRWLSVESECEDFSHEEEAVAARRALEMTLEQGNWPDLSDPAVSLWLDARGRDRTRAVAHVDPARREVAIDGRPFAFTVAESGEHWAAVARPAEDLSITITARGIPFEGIELVALDDPLTLLGPE
jgi:hypothetical protein